MRRYETIFISDPDLSEEDRKQLFEKTKDLIQSRKGFLVLFDDWGMKKLAYEIKNKSRGYYVRLDYCGDGGLVSEMERSFRIDDRVIKFMTIVLDKDADPEKVQLEIAREAEVKAARELAAREKTEENDSRLTESEETETDDNFIEE
ncbi:MAG: 30S ribosomal protein S6 [Desulfobacteraceae bacterium]|nr:MAG: 30S ribosomal protein S6 [Desulfobacteraceae bacterium]